MELEPVSDYFKLAILDLSGVVPQRAERSGGRYWAYFPKDKARKLLDEYDSGKLKVVARDLEAAVTRTKNKIFESERGESRR